MASTVPMNAGRRRALRERSDERVAADQARLRPDGTKVCTGCQAAKPLDAFDDDRSRPDGKRQRCLDCRAESLARRVAERDQDARVRAVPEAVFRAAMVGMDD